MKEIKILEVKELLNGFIEHYFKHLKLLETLSGQVFLTDELIKSQMELMNACKNTFLNIKYKQK